MTNYISINGIMSNTINGLLVSSLPTISKPEMRTKTTTVDGRDGDITEYLGFSAYDRTFTIGLYGSYDIDEVVKFFLTPETTNEFIFSNEPDKVYKGYISEAIDFEKLMRFKTASVTVHVQPFKFSAWERAKSCSSPSSCRSLSRLAASSISAQRRAPSLPESMRITSSPTRGPMTRFNRG